MVKLTVKNPYDEGTHEIDTAMIETEGMLYHPQDIIDRMQAAVTAAWGVGSYARVEQCGFNHLARPRPKPLYRVNVSDPKRLYNFATTAHVGSTLALPLRSAAYTLGCRTAYNLKSPAAQALRDAMFTMSPEWLSAEAHRAAIHAWARRMRDPTEEDARAAILRDFESHREKYVQSGIKIFMQWFDRWRANPYTAP